MKKLIIGNWKMNPDTKVEAQRIIAAVKKAATKLARTSVVLCPPFVYMPLVAGKGTSLVALGAQDVAPEVQGSYTGEVSANMLRDSGAAYVIIGHSERRAMGETDESISRKVARALEAGVSPVLCVGEKTHDSEGLYMEELRLQIRHSLSGIERKDAHKIIVAYEPVWAIGAKEAMTPANILETTIFVRKTLSDIFGQDKALKIPVLYGGSVNFKNAGEIVDLGKVDGLLVGRESINPPGFVELLKVVEALSK